MARTRLDYNLNKLEGNPLMIHFMFVRWGMDAVIFITCLFEEVYILHKRDARFSFGMVRVISWFYRNRKKRLVPS